jgi:hypothetical protein
MNGSSAPKLMLLLALLTPVSAVFAYRPFDATDADVADPGEYEIELGPLGYLHTADTNFVVVPNIVLNIGTRPGWEIVVEGQHRMRAHSEAGAPAHQLTDTGLFLKTLLRKGALQEETGPSIALEFGTLLPTLHDETGVGGAVLLAISFRRHLLTMHFNGEVAMSRSGAAELFGSMILEAMQDRQVRPVLELFVEGEAGASATVRSALIGAIWEASDRLSIDVGARMARADDRTERELRAGLTWSFQQDRLSKKFQ